MISHLGNPPALQIDGGTASRCLRRHVAWGAAQGLPTWGSTHASSEPATHPFSYGIAHAVVSLGSCRLPCGLWLVLASVECWLHAVANDAFKKCAAVGTFKQYGGSPFLKDAYSRPTYRTLLRSKRASIIDQKVRSPPPPPSALPPAPSHNSLPPGRLPGGTGRAVPSQHAKSWWLHRAGPPPGNWGCYH